MPSAAEVLPLPEPVWTMRSPRSSVFIAIILSRAALRLRILSAWRASMSSVSDGSVMAALCQTPSGRPSPRRLEVEWKARRHEHDAGRHRGHGLVEPPLRVAEAAAERGVG